MCQSRIVSSHFKDTAKRDIVELFPLDLTVTLSIVEAKFLFWPTEYLGPAVKYTAVDRCMVIVTGLLVLSQRRKGDNHKALSWDSIYRLLLLPRYILSWRNIREYRRRNVHLRVRLHLSRFWEVVTRLEQDFFNDIVDFESLKLLQVITINWLVHQNELEWNYFFSLSMTCLELGHASLGKETQQKGWLESGMCLWAVRYSWPLNNLQ